MKRIRYHKRKRSKKIFTNYSRIFIFDFPTLSYRTFVRVFVLITHEQYTEYVGFFKDTVHLRILSQNQKRLNRLSMFLKIVFIDHY